MLHKPTKDLYGPRSTASQYDVQKKMDALKQIEAHDCPWVEIGNLYVSMTRTGDTSWSSLIRRLLPHKEYALFTGRHGDLLQITDKKGTTLNVFDEGHVHEDVKRIGSAKIEFPGVNIKLFDTGSAKNNQKDWLRTMTRAQIKEGRKVIYAWCYSFFAMCETQVSDQPSISGMYYRVMNMPIDTQIKAYWSWANPTG